MNRRKKIKKLTSIAGIILLALLLVNCSPEDAQASENDGGSKKTEPVVETITYPIVDTAQDTAYDNYGSIMTNLQPGQQFYGQDSHYQSNEPSYRDNGDGTVTDLVTGLMWMKSPGDKKYPGEAFDEIENFEYAGYKDWRIPTIKELYSLILFTGITGMSESDSIPYIDTDYFEFEYGDTSVGYRMIDSQYLSSTRYVSTTMYGDTTYFGVNFADGRIKGYPADENEYSRKKFYFLYVRGNSDYGVNKFQDNGDDTIIDRATGLMWMKYDSGYFQAGDLEDGTLNWAQALEWAENMTFAGYSDWRLPNAKELQSIVDYTRSPATTGTAAINPSYFRVTDDESYYWTSTTHLDGPADIRGMRAAYIAFGRAMGYMPEYPGSDYLEYMDVHGAGAQRSDPKSGDPDDPMYEWGHGPQGDDIRIYNYVRLVRDAD